MRLDELKSTTSGKEVSTSDTATKSVNKDKITTVSNDSNSTSNESSSQKDNTTLEEYIFKDSDKIYLTEDDIKSVSKKQLVIARNEIFARHGYVFQMDEYKKYFSSKSWYVPNSNYDGNDSVLNKYELANYKLLQVWENKK